MQPSTTNYHNVLAERLAAFPTSYVQMLKSDFVRDLVRIIQLKNKLSDLVITPIENEIVLVFLGFEKMGDLSWNLMQNTGLNATIVGNIVQDVENYTPREVQQMLDEIINEQERSGQESGPVNPAPKNVADNNQGATLPVLSQTPLNRGKVEQASTTSHQPMSQRSPSQMPAPTVPDGRWKYSNDNESESTAGTPSVPRYARPLTGIPSYKEDDGNNNPHQ